jgi:hypothetical protein
MSSDRERLLAAVAQSPRLVAAHDRAGWCALFASDGQVNDPVGSRPHEGRAAIGNFYDTFIAPNQLTFTVDHDIVCGMSVMRDLSIVSVMATGLRISVPMHLRYDLIDEGGALKIRRLYAHWELPVMLAAQLSSLKGWLTSLQLTPRLLRHQGVAGLAGFMRGLGGHGRAGKRTAQTLFAALARSDAAAAEAACLAPGCTLEVPPGTGVALPELAAGLRGLAFRKLIGAGDYASATVQIGPQRGVAVCRFDNGPERISSLQIFV